VRQPASVSGEFTTEEAPHFPASAVFPRELPHPTWLTVGDATALPAQQGSSFYARPVKLSILMAAYNEENTITRAIDEILKADCPCEIELVVVDDGSTDATPTVLSQVNDPRVMMHRHQANQGKGAALLAPRSRSNKRPDRNDVNYLASLAEYL
jgi:hypothetical protein